MEGAPCKPHLAWLELQLHHVHWQVKEAAAGVVEAPTALRYALRGGRAVGRVVKMLCPAMCRWVRSGGWRGVGYEIFRRPVIDPLTGVHHLGAFLVKRCNEEWSIVFLIFFEGPSALGRR